jgi:hypothetical protein
MSDIELNIRFGDDLDVTFFISDGFIHSCQPNGEFQQPSTCSRYEALDISTQEDKYLCLVERCTSKGYGAKNHFCKHMFLHNLHVVWDNPGRPKNIISKLRVQNFKKYNDFVLSDEMARKEKKLNQHEKKWFKEATKAWKTLNSLEVVHKNKEKLVLASILFGHSRMGPSHFSGVLQ